MSLVFINSEFFVLIPIIIYVCVCGEGEYVCVAAAWLHMSPGEGWSGHKFLIPWFAEQWRFRLLKVILTMSLKDPSNNIMS